MFFFLFQWLKYFNTLKHFKTESVFLYNIYGMCSHIFAFQIYFLQEFRFNSCHLWHCVTDGVQKISCFLRCCLRQRQEPKETRHWKHYYDRCYHAITLANQKFIKWIGTRAMYLYLVENRKGLKSFFFFLCMKIWVK